MLGLKSISISKGTKDVTTPSDDLHDYNIIYQMKAMFRYTAKQYKSIFDHTIWCGMYAYKNKEDGRFIT